MPTVHHGKAKRPESKESLCDHENRDPPRRAKTDFLAQAQPPVACGALGIVLGTRAGLPVADGDANYDLQVPCVCNRWWLFHLIG
jgi:hypothetical protein